MINYCIQVILFQVLFLAAYDFFLSKETFFGKNRWYLLSTALLSFVLPFMRSATLQKAMPEEYTILLPEVVLSPQKVIEQAKWYQSLGYLDLLFYIGLGVFFFVFILKLEKIIRLVLQFGTVKKQGYKLVYIPKQTKAFSFFNFIFLGKEITPAQQEKIIEHELVHARQKHSIDLLFFEFLKIIMWFNPMIYIYQKRITLVHEYISDAVVLKKSPRKEYINHMLSDIFQVENISFVNQFYKHSLIKKRIIMMTKKKSKQIKQLKYLLLVPVLASMLIYVSCNENQESDLVSKQNDNKGYLGKITTNGQDYYFDKSKEGNLIFFDNSGNLIDEKIIFSENIEYLNLTKKFKIEEIIEEAVDDVDLEVVPFSIIETAPTFPGCPEGDKDCLNRKIMKFVQQNFDIEFFNKLGLSSGKKRIYIQFKIASNGDVTSIKARAPHPTLKEEAIRVAEKLPKMKPGLQKGKAVGVGYTLPISFNVE